MQKVELILFIKWELSKERQTKLILVRTLQATKTSKEEFESLHNDGVEVLKLIKKNIIC
jgi:hypothetical protein